MWSIVEYQHLFSNSFSITDVIILPEFTNTRVTLIYGV